MELKRLKWVDDIKIYQLGEDYILESDSKDIYCALNEEAYLIVNCITEDSTIENICQNADDYESAKSILEEIIELGLLMYYSNI